MKNISKSIKEKRLSLNIRADDLCKEVGISRATLSSIENGNLNCSAYILLRIFDKLGITVDLKNVDSSERYRASRINSSYDKKVNRFVVMCIEQYAQHKSFSSKEAYRLMRDNGLINDLKNDYEDFHGMSTSSINQYIDDVIGGSSL